MQTQSKRKYYKMNFERLFDVFYYQKVQYPTPTALNQKVKKEWIFVSTDECISTIESIAKGLKAIGIEKGDKVALVGQSSPLWLMVDIAILMVGGITIPIYPNITEKDYKFIFNQAEVKRCFVGDKGLYQKIESIRQDCPLLEEIYSLQQYDDVPYYGQIIDKGVAIDFAEIQKIMDSIDKMDLATISYTSGTGGDPKGVMLSHWNIVSNIMSTVNRIPVKPGMRSVSMLPTCHIFERFVVYLCVYMGVSIHFIGLESIGADLKEVKPHFFSTVPRIMEKIYEKIMETGDSLTGVQKSVFDWAHGLAERYGTGNTLVNPVYLAQLSIANKLVFNKWRAATGGYLFGIVTGGAALQPKLARIFTAAGIPVKQGYGQTESSPVIAVNGYNKGEYLIGTVGTPVDGVEVKIAEDGEILSRGSNNMMGYYKLPELSAEAIDADGWLHTGDIGILVEGKYLKITDRKKELFKNSGGKYIAPGPIENKYKESFYIDNIMIIGENQKTISALVVPNMDNLKKYAQENQIDYTDKYDLVKHPEILKLFVNLRSIYNKEFSEVEHVKKIALIPDPWTIEGGEITPTLKVKRKFVLAKYADVIDGIYGGE